MGPLGCVAGSVGNGEAMTAGKPGTAVSVGATEAVVRGNAARGEMKFSHTHNASHVAVMETTALSSRYKTIRRTVIAADNSTGVSECYNHHMPFLIDGHNLIGQLPGWRLDDPDDEQKLVVLLRGYLRRVKKKGSVVFDRGQPTAQQNLSNSILSVRFARPPATADDVIAELVRQERNPRGVVVVTSDARIRAAVRERGATVRDAASFARELLAQPALPNQKEKGLSAAEVEAWEHEFRSGQRRKES